MAVMGGTQQISASATLSRSSSSSSSDRHPALPAPVRRGGRREDHQVPSSALLPRERCGWMHQHTGVLLGILQRLAAAASRVPTSSAGLRGALTTRVGSSPAGAAPDAGRALPLRRAVPEPRSRAGQAAPAAAACLPARSAAGCGVTPALGAVDRIFLFGMECRRRQYQPFSNTWG